MIHCKQCIHWIDESLEQIEADRGKHTHIFMGCRIFGNSQPKDRLQSCKYYQASRDSFTICSSCRLTVPKLCVSLGECANCTDTDLFCIDNCIGGEDRKFCSHFVRLHTEGVHLIDKDRVFDLFPTVEMPGQKKPDAGDISSERVSKEDSGEKAKPQRKSRSAKARKKS
jgi:hypothetical protein